MDMDIITIEVNRILFRKRKAKAGGHSYLKRKGSLLMMDKSILKKKQYPLLFQFYIRQMNLHMDCS